jgi:putative hydrolase of the HAD superfamily
MSSRECRAILFDVGNVIVHVDFMRVLQHWAGCSGRSVESLRERFGFDLYYERHERGEIDAPAYFDSLRESLGLDLSDEQFAVGWNSVFVKEVDGIREVIERAARRAPVYAFSNTNEMHYVEWSSRFGDLFEPFDRVFVSCEIARRKPEREAYYAVASAIGVPTEGILFFDDRPENVDGARETGMRAVQVTTIYDVREALGTHLGDVW